MRHFQRATVYQDPEKDRYNALKSKRSCGFDPLKEVNFCYPKILAYSLALRSEQPHMLSSLILTAQIGIWLIGRRKDPREQLLVMRVTRWDEDRLGQQPLLQREETKLCSWRSALQPQFSSQSLTGTLTYWSSDCSTVWCLI